MKTRVAARLSLAAALVGALGVGAVEVSAAAPAAPAPVVQLAGSQPDQSAELAPLSAPGNDQDKDKGKPEDKGQGGNGVGTGSGTPPPLPQGTPNPGNSNPNGKGLTNDATGHVNHGTADGRDNASGNSGNAPANGHCKDRGNGHLYRDDGSACEASGPNVTPTGTPTDPTPTQTTEATKTPTPDKTPGAGNGNNPGGQQNIVAGVSALRTGTAQQAPAAAAANTQPTIVAAQSAQLPKTGVPALALLAGGLLSSVAGLGLRRLAR